jgi:hypothetical protein
MKRLLIAAMILAATSTPSLGYFVDGNELYKKCNSSTSDSAGVGYMDLSYCLAYIAGVSDTLDSARANNRLPVCVPVNVQAGQLKDVVTMYLRDNPSVRSMEANLLVVVALSDAWGCGTKK